MLEKKKTHVRWVPTCHSQREFGNCSLLVAGKCDKRHPKKICFEFKENGRCCKFRHPFSLRMFEKSQRTRSQNKQWVPQSATITDWRSNLKKIQEETYQCSPNSSASTSYSSNDSSMLDTFTL